MPTHRSGPGAERDPVRARRLVRQAQKRLESRGFEPDEARRFIRPLSRKLTAPELFLHPGDGLAAFLAADVCRVFRLPLSFRERVVIGERFYVKPLLPLATEEARFYVLALSQNQVRLLECSSGGVTRLTGPDLPPSRAEALGDEKFTPKVSLHTGSTPRPGAQKTVFHGGGDEDEKSDLRRFCRQVDGGLSGRLDGRKEPVVLAGVEYLTGLYREVSRYPHLLPKVLSGNPDGVSDEELRDRAWPLVEPHFLAGQRQAASRFAELAGTGRASNDVAEVLRAASEGRVDVLFLTGDADLWGRLEGRGGPVELHPAAEPGDEELLDVAAAWTLTQGGTAYAMARGEVPGGGDVAAVFRY
jgi:hypothetical protein